MRGTDRESERLRRREERDEDERDRQGKRKIEGEERING